MAHIRSRKHLTSQQPRLQRTAAFALAALALHASPYAQHTEPAPGTEATTAQETTLPEVKVKAATENSFKADTVTAPKLTQRIIAAPQTITVLTRERIQQ